MQNRTFDGFGKRVSTSATAGAAIKPELGNLPSWNLTDLFPSKDSPEFKAALEKALGKPSELQKLGPLEQWTYKTSDGSVTFVIAGDSVTLASGGTTKKP